MTRRLGVMTFIIVLLLGGLPIGWAAARARDGQDRLDAAHRELEDVRAAAETLATLDARTVMVGLQERPAEDVQVPLQAVLAATALDVRLLKSVRPGESVALDDGRHRRQSMVVYFNPISLADLGAILTAWGEREPAWRPSRLVLTAPPRRTGTDGRFSIEMTLSTIYLDDGVGS